MMINQTNSVKIHLKNIFPNTWLKNAFFFSWHEQSCQSFNTSLTVAPIPLLWQWHLLEVCPWFCSTDGRLFLYVRFINTAQKILLFTGNKRKIHSIILIFKYLSHQSNHWRNWVTATEIWSSTWYKIFMALILDERPITLTSSLNPCVNLKSDFSCHLLVESTKSHHAQW